MQLQIAHLKNVKLLFGDYCKVSYALLSRFCFIYIIIIVMLKQFHLDVNAFIFLFGSYCNSRSLRSENANLLNVPPRSNSVTGSPACRLAVPTILNCHLMSDRAIPFSCTVTSLTVLNGKKVTYILAEWGGVNHPPYRL
jgi:hypothetical protein